MITEWDSTCQQLTEILQSFVFPRCMQDSNPRIKSGEIPPYNGIMDCFKRVSAEQGVSLPHHMYIK